MTGSDVQLALQVLADCTGAEGVIVVIDKVANAQVVELRSYPGTTMLGSGPSLAEALRKALTPHAADAQRVELAFRSLGVVA